MIETLIDIVPLNPVGSLADGNLLQIIFFALVFGIAVTLVPGDRAKPLIALLRGGQRGDDPARLHRDEARPCSAYSP